MHFEKDSAVHHALRTIAERLAELGIPFAIAGGMALFLHGYRRFTEDVDILVTADDLQRIHESLEGRGYLPVYSGSRNLRETSSGVRIEFLVAGQFPGDGKPKPIQFPNPQADAVVLIDDVPCLALETLVELKLASGTAKGRRKDLGDVQELIRILGLPRDIGEHLDASVRELFFELWDELIDTNTMDQELPGATE